MFQSHSSRVGLQAIRTKSPQAEGDPSGPVGGLGQVLNLLIDRLLLVMATLRPAVPAVLAPTCSLPYRSAGHG